MHEIKLKLEKIFSDHNILHITSDSREVKKGSAYFAIPGSKYDGNDFIEEARSRGARLIFTSSPSYSSGQSVAQSESRSEPASDIIFIASDTILVNNIRYAIAVAAGIIYPKLPPKLIAVTGTNGKTSVVFYIYSILAKMGIKVAGMGTLGVITNVSSLGGVDRWMTLQGGLTTADPISFRKTLHDLADQGVEILSFEASSHGIDQYRLGDIQVDAAGFTSFSQDHLDYHGSMDNYLAAKMKLFVDHLKSIACVVIPSDIDRFDEIVSRLNDCQVKYRIISHADSTTSSANRDKKNNIDEDRVAVKIHSVETSLTGQLVRFSYKDGRFKDQEYQKDRADYDCVGDARVFDFDHKKLYLDIVGSFQVNNVFIAIELIRSLGIKLEDILEKADHINAVTGRLQRVSPESDLRHVFVDYAHTPDALEKSLNELKKLKHPQAKLIVLFGCGGNRDKTKRPIMGKIAYLLADLVIITDDNPRHEDPLKIRQEIIAGITSVNVNDANKYRNYIGKNIKEIAGRAEAIEFAIKSMDKNDILLIAGKGHEEYQIVGDDILPFSDALVVRNFIS